MKTWKIVEMQKDKEFQIHLTEPQVEVLQRVTEAWGYDIDEYLHTAVIQRLESDIDLHFGPDNKTRETLRGLLSVDATASNAFVDEKVSG